MSGPLDYLNVLNFNTKRFQKFSQIVEQFPATDTPDVKVCVCRCWQSKKFPYCDGTHKILMENGDNVGPYVAILKSPKTAKNNLIRIKKLNPNANKNFVQTPAKSSKVILIGSLVMAPVIYFFHNKLDNRLNYIKSSLNKLMFNDEKVI